MCAPDLGVRRGNELGRGRLGGEDEDGGWPLGVSERAVTWAFALLPDGDFLLVHSAKTQGAEAGSPFAAFMGASGQVLEHLLGLGASCWPLWGCALGVGSGPSLACVCARRRVRPRGLAAVEPLLLRYEIVATGGNKVGSGEEARL